jgi:membrane protease YdiL (CAAX protease family)
MWFNARALGPAVTPPPARLGDAMTSDRATAAPATPIPARVSLTAVAWIGTLLVSRLPEMVLREGLRIETPWMPWAILALSVGLWLAARAIETIRPLERYFLLLAVLGLVFAVQPLLFKSNLWHAIVPVTSHPMVSLIAERVVLALLALAIIALVLRLGTSREEAYLVRGDLNAPTTSGRPGSATGEKLRWGVFGPIAFVGLLLLTVFLSASTLPARIDVGAALPFIAIAAVAALLNAFWEEVAYRAAPLSQLARVVGPTAGVLILATWFGLGHFYDAIPSGAIGAFAAGAVALLFGRAMVETRGLAWPVALHVATDFVLYLFLALAASSPAG